MVTQALETVAGTRSANVVEIPRTDLATLAAQVRAGAASESAAQQLHDWQLEPASLPLNRLGEYAKELSVRLGKGTLQVDIRGDVRTDPGRHAALWSSLVHLVRNAVDHGLEDPAERKGTTKEAVPNLALRARRVESQLLVEIEDDGRGIQWEKVREAARQRGLAADSHEDLVQALLAPNVTTRQTASTTSGRGIGMNAVLNLLSEVGGKISVESTPGQGCLWTLTVPGAFGSLRPAPPSPAPPSQVPPLCSPRRLSA